MTKLTKRIIKFTVYVVFIAILIVSGDVALKKLALLSQGANYAIQTKIHGANAYNYLDVYKRPRNTAKPYLLYANTPNYSNEYGPQHDEFGYRETEETTNISASHKILAIGGSTTYGYSVNSADEVWTHELQELFLDSEKSVDVINGGLNWATTSELLAKYVFKDQWIDHDLLIIHTGGNEILPIFFPDFQSDYTHVRNQTGQTSGNIEKDLLEKSGILSHAWSIWSAGSDFGLYKGQPFSFKKLVPEEVDQRISIDERYTTFYKNVSSIVEIAKSHGRRVLIIPFVNNHYNPSYNRNDLSHLNKQIELHQIKMTDILSTLAKEKYVDLYKIERGAISESSFTDNCHLNVDGQKEKALSIYMYLERE
jgi:lysophospholipase L1-like esterase